jgi:hypothetical protein
MQKRNTRTEVILLRNCAGLRLKDIGFLLNEYAVFSNIAGIDDVTGADDSFSQTSYTLLP